MNINFAESAGPEEPTSIDRMWNYTRKPAT